MRIFFASVVIIITIFSGCVPNKETATHELTLSLPDVLNRVRERHAYIKTLKGSGSITVEAPKVSNSGSFDVDLKKPDSVLVELHGPFGIHVGTLSLSRDQFIFFNRMENTAVIGKPDGRTLQSMFQLNMEFDEILHAFTGEFPLSVEQDSLMKFYVDEGMYVARYKDGDGEKEYRIDGSDFIINSYRVLDAAGKVTLNASATRHNTVQQIAMPTLLRVIFPIERRSVTIAYDNIRLNEPVGCFFALPDQVERIYR